jgi:putative glutamine amidotransferase
VINPEEPARISFEISLLREIIKERKPVFGICYGMQLINIFFRRTLYQDIGLQVPGSVNHGKGGHTISITSNPYIKEGEYSVESSHHQAVKKAGKGLKPFAFATDGLVEGVYHEDFVFVVGVQWHPERTAGPLTAQLFKSFIAASEDAVPLCLTREQRKMDG